VGNEHDDDKVCCNFWLLYIEMQDESLDEIKGKLKQAGLQTHPAGFVTKSLITCNFCKGAEKAGLAIAKTLDEAIAGLEVPSPLKLVFQVVL
jgi:precorrin-3B C17-methyltransferase